LSRRPYCSGRVCAMNVGSALGVPLDYSLAPNSLATSRVSRRGTGAGRQPRWSIRPCSGTASESIDLFARVVLKVLTTSEVQVKFVQFGLEFNMLAGASLGVQAESVAQAHELLRRRVDNPDQRVRH